jgi:2-iminobutanoate/2-iminopropanoate deaminase
VAGIERHVDVPGLMKSGDWGYAQVVVADNLIFVAGQAGNDEDGNLTSLEFGPQVRQAFANIARALESVGATLADLVATTTFITDWRYGSEFGAIRSEILGENLATSATIGVQQLASPGMLIEIQSTAVRPRG